MTRQEPQSDEDQVLRQMLQSQVSSTSAAHDAAVLQAARDFARTDAPRRRASLVPNWAWAAAAGVMVIIASGAVWREQALRREFRALTAQQHVLTLVSSVLTPGVSRGDDSLAEVEIPAGIGTVRLRLELAATTNRHDIEMSLATRAGRQVWRGGALTVQTHGSEAVVTAEIPADLLGSGQYELSLREGDVHTDYYYFEVRRE